MVLQRVIRKVLLPFCKHHPIDLGGRPSADQGYMLIDFGQPAAESANRPLQAGIAIDQRLLMSEMPDSAAPVLQVHVAQSGARSNEQFNRSAVQPRTISPCRLRQERGLGSFLEDHQRVIQIDRSARQSGENVQRLIDRHALGHIEQ